VLSFSGPNGSITATGITKITTTQYLVTFASQSTAGAYNLLLGPNITTAAGTKLDQDWDGVTGESTDDRFSVIFYVAAGAATSAAVTSWQYDANSRVTRVTQADSGQYNYTYTAAGEVASEADPLGHTRSMQYDAIGRLSQVTLPDPDGSSGPLSAPVYVYSYDKNSNLRFVTDPLNNQDEFAYDARDRRTDWYQADPDGNGALTRPHTQYVFNAPAS